EVERRQVALGLGGARAALTEGTGQARLELTREIGDRQRPPRGLRLAVKARRQPLRNSHARSRETGPISERCRGTPRRSYRCTDRCARTRERCPPCAT